MLSSTLSGELRTDAVTASVSDEVERVERLFTGVVSDVICWFSEDKLAGVGPVASEGHSFPASAW